MDCTLFIPHLLPPRELADALWRTVDAPQLKSMLARAAMSSDAAVDAEAWLFRRFGIERQQDFPVAPLLATPDYLRPGPGYWVNATPVHLETRRNALVLASPDTLGISKTEAETFAATLGYHFLLEKIDVYAPHPNRWFLRCDTPPAMTTSSLAAVTGRDVRSFLPRGADSARWHRILTEIQMLLHAHPLNEAREARGLLSVNSVWLWGGGTLPPRPLEPKPKPYDTVWSDDATVRALAYHCQCDIQSRPAALPMDSLKGTSHFFSFEFLDTHMRHGDVQAWSNAVTALERDWFSRLATAVKSGALTTLTIVSVNDSGSRQFVIRRRDKFKILFKNKYLQ